VSRAPIQLPRISTSCTPITKTSKGLGLSGNRDQPWVQPGVEPKVLVQTGPALWKALLAIGERRFPHVRYDFEDGQNVLETEIW